MIIVLAHGVLPEQIERVQKAVRAAGMEPKTIPGAERTIIACVGDERGRSQLLSLNGSDGVETVMPILVPYKLASLDFHFEPTNIQIGSANVGRSTFTVIAGPCSVEDEKQMMLVGDAVKARGVPFLRGGAFKPRTSPYYFRGLGEEGLQLMAAVRERTGLLIVSELMDKHDLPLFERYVDVIQIGARNCQNFTLLDAVGESTKPVILKRGPSITIAEWLMSAEYILAKGNPNVILCERGIRTFETAYRNVLDLNAIPDLKSKTHLPVIVDPSHGTGKRNMVLPLTRAAMAVGADGIMIEVHPNPEQARSDGQQSLNLDEFNKLMDEVERLAPVFNRQFAPTLLV